MAFGPVREGEGSWCTVHGDPPRHASCAALPHPLSALSEAEDAWLELDI